MKLPKINDKAETDLAKYVARLETVLEKSADEANDRFGEYLRQLLDKSRIEQERLTTDSQKRINEYVDELQKDLKNEIAADMQTVKTALAEYQKTRMAQIEGNLAETIQRAAELYLEKKLDPETHMELIYEALEKAKQEKLITV